MVIFPLGESLDASRRDCARHKERTAPSCKETQASLPLFSTPLLNEVSTAALSHGRLVRLSSAQTFDPLSHARI